MDIIYVRFWTLATPILLQLFNWCLICEITQIKLIIRALSSFYIFTKPLIQLKINS